MSDWCIQHKCEASACAQTHEIAELKRQLDAAGAIINGVGKMIGSEYDDRLTLTAKLDELVNELVIARAVLRLPILFYTGGPVTDEIKQEWREVTGSDEMTTKVMCDAIRRIAGVG